MTNEQIVELGRRKTINHLIVATFLTFVTPIIIAWLQISLTSGIDSISLHPLSQVFNETWTIIQIISTAIGLTLTAYFIGPWTARQISARPKHSFLIGIATFLIFWFVFFLTYITVDGFKRAEIFGNTLLDTIFNGWLPLTIILFAIIAIPTSTLFGYFLGRSIKRKLNENNKASL